jgi:hypothetical protein
MGSGAGTHVVLALERRPDTRSDPDGEAKY